MLFIVHILFRSESMYYSDDISQSMNMLDIADNPPDDSLH